MLWKPLKKDLQLQILKATFTYVNPVKALTIKIKYCYLKSFLFTFIKECRHEIFSIFMSKAKSPSIYFHSETSVYIHIHAFINQILTRLNSIITIVCYLSGHRNRLFN